MAITWRVLACREPTDVKVPELAINGDADLIVSGDVDLLVLAPFRGIPILSLAALVQRNPPYAGPG